MWTRSARKWSMLGGVLLLAARVHAQLAPEIETQELIPLAPAFATGIGTCFDAEGDWLVAGAFFDDASFGHQGSVRAFRWVGSAWVETDKLFAADGGFFDQFGKGLSLDGGTLIVGAPGHDFGQVNQGMAYAFRLHGGLWVEEQQLFPGEVDVNQAYGRLVAASGSRAFVYGGFDDSPGLPNQSALFVFRRTATGWVEESPIVLDGPLLFEGGGASLAASGDLVAVGTAFADVGGSDAQGSVAVFELADGVWSRQATLVAGDGAPGDNFGWAVSLQGERLAVSAMRRDTTPDGNEGALYCFRRDGESWTPEPVVGAVVPPDAFLGTSLALDGSQLVAGAERYYAGEVEGGPIGKGAVFSHRWTGTEWQPVNLFVASNGGTLDQLGWAVTLSGPMVVAGSPNHVPATQPFTKGTGYAFDSLPPGWAFRGGAVAGVSGHPILGATGELDGGDTVTLRLEQAAPIAPAVLVIGLSALQAPFKGGVLVPYPDAFVGGLVTNAQGELPLSATWPTLPGGTTLYFQHWIVDGAAPAGLAASNGVRALVP